MLLENTMINKVGIYRIASYCALISAFLILLGLVLLILFPIPDAQSSLSERLNFIASHPMEWVLPFLNLLFLVLAQFPIGLALYFLTRYKNATLALFGAISGFVALVIGLQNAFILVSAIPRMAQIYASTSDELLKYAIIANFNSGGLIQLHSFSFSQLTLCLTLLGGMGLLFGIGLLKSVKLVRVVSWFLLAAGVFGVIGLLGYLANQKLVQMATLVQIFIYFSTLLIMFPMFQHEAQVEHAITNK